LGCDEVKEFFIVGKDGFTFDDTPMLVHLQTFKGFPVVLHEQDLLGRGLTDDDVMGWTREELGQYCCTKAYHDDYAAAFTSLPIPLSC
jgi:hypothetical protein